MIAEIGLEELTGLEMEVMRRQASVYCARDPLGAWKQNHGVLVWVGLDSDGAARLEVVQPFQSPYPSSSRGEVRLPSPFYQSLWLWRPIWLFSLSLCPSGDVERK